MITTDREEIKIADPASKTRKDVFLVAGEDEVRRALIGKILSARGYKVECLKETHNISKKLEEAEYKIVIIDIIDYKKDPRLLLQKIKVESASAPVITLVDRNIVNTYGLTADKLLLSPLDPKDLLDAVGEMSKSGEHFTTDTPLNPPLSGETQVITSTPRFFRGTQETSFDPTVTEDVSVSDKRIIAIGGGKGGVGKSVVTANLATGLAKAGKKVIAVDLDLGGPNLHTFLGIRKLPRGLFDFLLRGEVSLADITHQTKIEGLKIIGISEDFPDASNIKHQQKIKLIENLKQLDADYILLDLGSGATSNVVDFFSVSGSGVVVSSPEITSVLNTYNFIKTVLYKKIERYLRIKGKKELCEIVRISADPENEMKIKRISELEKELIKRDPDAGEMISFVKKNFGIKVIINMAKNSRDEKMGNSIKNIVKKYLDVDIDYLGVIKRDAAVEKSVISMTPLMQRSPASAASFNIKSILSKMQLGVSSYE